MGQHRRQAQGAAKPIPGKGVGTSHLRFSVERYEATVLFQQQIWALALVAFLIPLPLPRTAPRTDGRAWRDLLAGFQARGVVVLTTHPRCQEPDLDGLYVHGRREVVVCPRGEPSTTLRHEGWHLVQNLCLGGRTWLSPQTVENHLRRDREELALLVRPERRPWEAEARVMAKVRPADYLQAVDRACIGQGLNRISRLEFKNRNQHE
jgi:hypothetical protein